MDEEQAMEILQRVAMMNGVPLDIVVEEIDLAIQEGIQSPDPQIQARWKQIPRRGEIPTATELLRWLAEQTAAEIPVICGNVPHIES